MTKNYWVGGAGKCALGVTIHQIREATGYSVYGHDSKYNPWQHQSHTIVHSNQTPIPLLPYSDYTCTMVLRRDLIQQAMESWVGNKRFYIDPRESLGAFTNYVKHIKLRIIRASDQPWAVRRVVYAEDILANPEKVMRQTYDLPSVELLPDLNHHRPHAELAYYREVRQFLTYRFAQDFEEVNYLLEQFEKPNSQS